VTYILLKNKPKFHADLRRDTNAMAATIDPGHWALLFVSIIVVVIIVAALFGPLNTALTSLAANQTSIGPTFRRSCRLSWSSGF